MDVESGLLIGAIGSLASALVYLYRRSEAANAEGNRKAEEAYNQVKADLDSCLGRERNHWEGKPDDEN